MNLRIQINSLGGMFADYVEFTGKKEEFLKHMDKIEAQRKKEESKSPEVKAEVLD